MTTVRRHWGPIAVISVALTFVGCATDVDVNRITHGDELEVTAVRAPGGSGDAEDAAYILENLRAMSEARNVVGYAKSFADYLPNQSFSISGGEPFTLSRGVVRGKVVEARPGAAYYVPGDELSPDASTGTEIDFYDKRAQWRHIEVIVEVADGLGDVPKSGQLSFAIVSGSPDAARALRGAAALGEVIVALEGTGHVDFNPEVHTVAHWGDAIATVDDNGVLTFPAFEDEAILKEFVGELTTWEAIKAQAAVTKPVAEVGDLLDYVK